MQDEHFTFEGIQDFITQAMCALGLPKADSALIGELMAKADLQGSDGHGINGK